MQCKQLPGTHNHRSARGKVDLKNQYILPAKYKTIPELIRKAGYHTFNRGKDDYNFTYDRHKLYTSGNQSSYKYPENGWQGLSGTGAWSDRKDKSQPWFGQIQLRGGKAKLKLDNNNILKAGDVPLPPYFPNTKVFNKAWTHHWNSARQTDLHVKRIIDDLKADGEYENTIIFLFSDHGDNFSLRHKQFCYEGGLHVPLIISGKHELIKKGMRRSEIMSGLDISATTLALAGITLPDYLEGQDLFLINIKNVIISSLLVIVVTIQLIEFEQYEVNTLDTFVIFIQTALYYSLSIEMGNLQCVSLKYLWLQENLIKN